MRSNHVLKICLRNFQDWFVNHVSIYWFELKRRRHVLKKMFWYPARGVSCNIFFNQLWDYWSQKKMTGPMGNWAQVVFWISCSPDLAPKGSILSVTC